MKVQQILRKCIIKVFSVSDGFHSTNDESQGNSSDKPDDSVNNFGSDNVDCNSYNDVSNGTVPKEKGSKSKKKLMRGRPRKALVAMYHSQISGDKNTIKIRIKKSGLAQVQVSAIIDYKE